jgi:hypothetical protein
MKYIFDLRIDIRSLKRAPVKRPLKQGRDVLWVRLVRVPVYCRASSTQPSSFRS